MERVLLIDDSEESQTLIRTSLQKIALVSIAPTPQAAKSLLQSHHYFLLLINMSSFRNAQLVSDLLPTKMESRPRIIYLVQKDEECPPVSPSDEIIYRPLVVPELTAKVEEQLRLARREKSSPHLLQVGNLILDQTAHQAQIEGSIFDLTPKELKLLSALARNEARVYSREQLLEILGSGKVHVTDRTIDTHLCRIRKKLRMYGCSHNIKAMHGVGYRFVKVKP